MTQPARRWVVVDGHYHEVREMPPWCVAAVVGALGWPYVVVFVGGPYLCLLLLVAAWSWR